ncbi:MAG: cohesin domain-containing protein [Phycisphaerales bacterium]
MHPKIRCVSVASATLAMAAASAATAASNLSLTASDATIGAGQKLVVTVGLNGDAVNGVAGQFILNYDTSKLSLDASGSDHYSLVSGSALDLELYESNNAQTGVYSLALGTSSGTGNAELSGGFVTLTFTCQADFCATSNLVTFSSSGGSSSGLSNAAAAFITLDAATNLGSVTRDTVAPSLVDVPAGVSYWADADGSNAAAVSITAPTASDSCDGSVDVTYARSNGSGLSSFAAGQVTTITWTATDDCGNTATSTTTVDVSADSLALVSAAQGGAFAASEAFTRGLRAEFAKSSASDSDTQTITLTPAGSGASSRSEGSVTVYASGATNWADGCARVSDPLHTLRRAISVTSSNSASSFGGRSYNSRFLVDASASADYLAVGNANSDTVIDILDFSTFVAQRGSSLDVNTTASTSGPHTDFNASGVANNADLSFLAVNFFQVDETCGGSYNGAAPMERISVRQLRRMGLGSQAIADINNDGGVDSTDIALLMQGVEPGSKRPQPTLTTSW